MSSKHFSLKALAAAALVAVGMAAVGQAQATANIIINNINAPGVGFNDPTPIAPAPGNPGTTRGEQRLIAFTYAAQLWAATLTSNVDIVVNAQFTSLACGPTGNVLGSAGAATVSSNFANAPKPDTQYSAALANKIANVDLAPGTQDINTNFNADLIGSGPCGTSVWYYGLDSNEPAGSIDFVAVLQHELAHGLGFQTFTSGSTGNFFGGLPSIWDHFLFSAIDNVLWKDATPAQRRASAISVDKLVWTGAAVNGSVPEVLRIGLPGVGYSGPAAGVLAGSVIAAGEASWGPELTNTGVTGEVMPVVALTTGAGLTGPGCGPLAPNDARAVQGKIAVIDRGVCPFTAKVKNAQDAGAIGVLIADNAPGSPPAGLGGADPSITIPAVRITLDDGNALKAQLKKRSRTSSGVFARIGLFGTQIAGADEQGRMKMYAPAVFAGGSSVSHFDVSASPNQLMEPSINSNLTQSLLPPQDLTYRLFQDIGWEVEPPVPSRRVTRSR